MIAATWNSHYGQQCIGMNWDLFPSQLADAQVSCQFYQSDTFHDLMNHFPAQDLAVCIGGALAARICERLAKDYRHCRGGVPDLTLWSPTTQRCKVLQQFDAMAVVIQIVTLFQLVQFVEVKGPGDRLSQKQVLWLDYLTTSIADAEVCKVKGKVLLPPLSSSVVAYRLFSGWRSATQQ